MPVEVADEHAFPFSMPLVFLLVLAAIHTVGLSALTLHAVFPPSQESSGLWSIIFGLILAWWIYADRAARKFKLPYEFEYFVLFAWPIVVPYYLYRRIGWRGLFWGVGIWGLFIVPYVVAAFFFVAAQVYPSR
jgi:hypothetical protein